MFNFFNRPTYPKIETPTYDVPLVETAKEDQEHYRVGYNSTNNMTTLTLKSDQTSMTLSLIPSEVKRLIRMLEASMVE